jgi:hypothetical protein
MLMQTKNLLQYSEKYQQFGFHNGEVVEQVGSSSKQTYADSLDALL